jgi:protein-disulfide isomerase
VLRTLSRLKEAYIDTGQVRYIVKNFPLPSHTYAQATAEAASCAGAQGAYWDMHQRLFEEQPQWSRLASEALTAELMRYAQELGLDTAVFGRCLESGQYGEQVRREQREGVQAGVQGTPSFLINGQLLEGARSFEIFAAFIEAELELVP